MWSAFEPGGERNVYRFRDFDALLRRLGGNRASYQIDHGIARGVYTCLIVLGAPLPHQGGCPVITELMVPTAAMPGPYSGPYDDGSRDR